ncbi:hypothetical protein BT67DRAFT_452907, partial [Trichocladium antarcticum]
QARFSVTHCVRNARPTQHTRHAVAPQASSQLVPTAANWPAASRRLETLRTRPGEPIARPKAIRTLLRLRLSRARADGIPCWASLPVVFPVAQLLASAAARLAVPGFSQPRDCDTPTIPGLVASWCARRESPSQQGDPDSAGLSFGRLRFLHRPSHGSCPASSNPTTTRALAAYRSDLLSITSAACVRRSLLNSKVPLV